MCRPALLFALLASLIHRSGWGEGLYGMVQPAVQSFFHPLRMKSAYQRAEAFGVRAWVAKFTCTMPKRLP